MRKKIKLRVAFIVPSLDSKGPVIFVQNLIHELKDNIEHIEIFYFKNLVKLNPEVKYTKISFWHKYNFDDFDIVHTNGAVPDIYAAIYIDKRKWLSSMHNFFEEDINMLYANNNFIKGKLIIYIWKIAMHKSKNIIVSSYVMKSYYEKLLGNKNYAVIPYGLKNYSIVAPISEDDLAVLKKFKGKNYLILGTVGLMIERKGFDQLLHLLKNESNYALIIIGDGPEREKLENLAINYHINNRVYMPGYRNNVSSYYKYIDIFAHVSYSEGFALVVLEALSCKLPLVCSSLDIYKEYFFDNEVGFFTPDDINSLSEAVERVKSNINHYSEASYQLYQKNFLLENMSKKHIDYYLSVLKNA